MYDEEISSMKWMCDSAATRLGKEQCVPLVLYFVVSPMYSSVFKVIDSSCSIVIDSLSDVKLETMLF